MRLFIILFVSLIISIKSKEEANSKTERLTYIETLDEDNTYYIINTKEEYKEIKNLKKNEIYKNSSSYSYEWSNHTINTKISLNNYLPKSDTKYRNMTNYDTFYLNIYSKQNIDEKIAIVIECQERTPDEASKMKVSYKYFNILLDFEGWKEFKISYKVFEDGYGGDLTRVSGLAIHSKGYGCVPNEETELFIDKIAFTTLKYKFNMEPSEITEENYLNVLKRFKFSILGSANILIEQNSNIVNRLKSDVKTAISNHNKMNKTGLPFDYPMNSSNDINSIYSKINQMARGYSIEGGEIYKNETFFEDLMYCLDYMHENYYTKRYQKIINGSDNWYHWDIGIPQYIVEILTYLKDELTQDQIDKYLEPLNNYIFYPKKTMANRVDIGYSCIIAGIFQKDYKRIAVSVEMLRELFNNVEYSDGFYEDGSFIQHEVFAYVGGYGESLINSLSRITYILEDSCFRFDDDMKEKQYNLIINSYIPFMYDGAFFDLVRGREVSRNTIGLGSGNNVVRAFTFIIKYIKNQNNIKLLKSHLKYLYNKNKDYYNSSLGIGGLAIIDEIINDESIIPENIIKNFSKVYSRMDKAISQINNIGIGISLSSSRTGKYESINGENKNGWYQGDGMTYIYLSPNDYANSYWPYINPYRLPGTTVTNAPRELKTLSEKNALAKFDFVGGTYSDIHMVSVMKFASESPKVNFNSSLIGNKAYFTFENCLVFIGNNISCNDSYEVETIIENRKLNGKFYFGDKEVIEKRGNVDNNYIYIENYGGIYLPDYTNVKYNITNNEFLEIYITHGENIINEKYKYFILPNVNKTDLKKYVNNIQILSDNSKITAVKNKLNNVKEYVFWEKGSFENIKVDNPCTLILYDKEFYISEPSQKINEINISIDNKNFNVKLRKGYTYKVIINKENNNNKILYFSIQFLILLFLLLI